MGLIPHAIIQVLFQRGAFEALDTQNTSLALLVYAAGLPAFVLNKVFSPGFFAREDTMTPLRYAAVSVAVNIAASITLFQFYAFAGIAAGTTIAAWVNAGLLGLTLARRGGFVPDAQVLTRLPLILVASGAMGAALWYGALYAAPYFEGTFLESVAALAALILGGMIAYAGLAQATGAVSLATLRRSFMRR